jgi:hypothetical protein
LYKKTGPAAWNSHDISGYGDARNRDYILHIDDGDAYAAHRVGSYVSRDRHISDSLIGAQLWICAWFDVDHSVRAVSSGQPVIRDAHICAVNNCHAISGGGAGNNQPIIDEVIGDENVRGYMGCRTEIVRGRRPEANAVTVSISDVQVKKRYVVDSVRTDGSDF